MNFSLLLLIYYLKIAKEKIQSEKERREKLELAMVTALFEKEVSIENFAKIMNITPKAVEKILGKKQ